MEAQSKSDVYNIGHSFPQSYPSSKIHIYTGRQEHRVSIALLDTMVSILNQRMRPTTSDSKHDRPHVVHPIQLVNQLTEGIILTCPRLFQKILCYASTGYLPEEEKIGIYI